MPPAAPVPLLEQAYGEKEKASGKQRGFRIHTSESAYDTQLHPLIRRHPETGEECLFGCLGYIIGIDGMEESEAEQLLLELYLWQNQRTHTTQTGAGCFGITS